MITYLLRVYDKQNILGPNPASEQAHVDYDKWTFFLVSTLGPMQGQVNWFSHGHPTKNNDALTRNREQALRTYGVLEGQLKATGGASILPQGFGAVHSHFLCWVKVHDFGGLALDGYPHVKKWIDGLLERMSGQPIRGSTVESRCSLIDFCTVE